jgi:hypothetical protein
MPRTKNIEQILVVDTEGTETTLNEAKIAIEKIPKIVPKIVTIDKVMIHITDDKFFDDEDIKKEFTIIETITIKSDILDMFGNQVFKEFISKGVDENGKKVEILSYEKMTKDVKQKVVKKVYLKEFNILDLKIKDIEFYKYFDTNKTMQVKAFKPYTTRFDGWIPETQNIGNGKTLLHLFIR